MSRKNWSSKKIYKSLLTNKSKKTYWDNIRELRSRPNKDVYEKAYSLTNSNSKKEIIIGIDILAQLGFAPRLFKKKTLKRYFEIVNKANIYSLIDLIEDDFTGAPIDDEDDFISSGLFVIGEPEIELQKLNEITDAPR